MLGPNILLARRDARPDLAAVLLRVFHAREVRAFVDVGDVADYGCADQDDPHSRALLTSDLLSKFLSLCTFVTTGLFRVDYHRFAPSAVCNSNESRPRTSSQHDEHRAEEHAESRYVPPSNEK